MANEFITETDLDSLFIKTAPTKADTIQGGGILIQSGLGNFNTNTMTATVNFPKTFPTKCCVVQLTPNNYYGSYTEGDNVVLKSFTNSSVTVQLLGLAPANNRKEFFWLAIGY